MKSSVLQLRRIICALYSLCLLSFSAKATELIHLTFHLDSGEKYEAQTLLPSKNKENRYQLTYQSLHSITLLAGQFSETENLAPRTKQVTYGLTVKSKPVPAEDKLYRFSLEYMGLPTIGIQDEPLPNVVLKSSQEDISYEVSLALIADKPVCNSVSRTIGDEKAFGSTFCITLITN